MPNRTVAPRVRSLCALLVAVVLGVAVLPALGATTATAAADTRVTTGTITWGVKASFRDYLTKPFAQGSAATTPPATTRLRRRRARWASSRRACCFSYRRRSYSRSRFEDTALLSLVVPPARARRRCTTAVTRATAGHVPDPGTV